MAGSQPTQHYRQLAKRLRAACRCVATQWSSRSIIGRPGSKLFGLNDDGDDDDDDDETFINVFDILSTKRVLTLFLFSQLFYIFVNVTVKLSVDDFRLSKFLRVTEVAKTVHVSSHCHYGFIQIISYKRIRLYNRFMHLMSTYRAGEWGALLPIPSSLQGVSGISLKAQAYVFCIPKSILATHHCCRRVKLQWYYKAVFSGILWRPYVISDFHCFSLGAVEVVIYIADLVEVIHQHDVTFHAYADDSQLYTHCQRDDIAATATHLSVRLGHGSLRWSHVKRS